MVIKVDIGKTIPKRQQWFRYIKIQNYGLNLNKKQMIYKRSVANRIKKITRGKNDKGNKTSHEKSRELAI